MKVFKSVHGNKVQAGKMYIAQIWHTAKNRETRLVKVLDVAGERLIKNGVTVTCDKFSATTLDNKLMTSIDGKMKRVTFSMFEQPVLLLAGPAASANIVDKLVAKRARDAARKRAARLAKREAVA